MAAPSDRTTVKRPRDPGRYERETLDAILDEALICLPEGTPLPAHVAGRARGGS